jgi:hypothetical protein
MELWGTSLYGNPCRECGYDWSVRPHKAIRQVQTLPQHFTALLRNRSGRERHPDLDWTPAAYVSHVTDNLRNWAERLAGARLAGAIRVTGFDPDLLACARRYNEIALPGALWSLQGAVNAWTECVSSAIDQHVVLHHATRGEQRADDVVRNNAHDGAHHAWDIQRILSFSDGSDER